MKDLESKVAELKAKYDFARKTLKAEKAKLETARTELAAAEKARAIIQEVAGSVQKVAAERLSAVVSKCLAAVFDDPYEFKFVFEKKRGKTEARPVFYKDGNEVQKVGGSVTQVAAFAMRLTKIIMSNPPKDKVMIMDEAFGGLDGDNVSRVAAMISSLSHELNVQFIMATHNPKLMIGNIIRLGESK